MATDSKRVRDDDDLRWVASDERGRRFLNRLINGWSGAIQPSFAGEKTHATANREGRRWVGLRLIAEMQRVVPAEWLHMLEEAVERQQEVKPPTDGDEDDDAD